METERIRGGAFQIARKIFESDIWLNKPSTWKVIWVYILGNVNHRARNGFERGEGFFMFSKCLHEIGRDITVDMIKKSSSYFKQNGMISTKRSTRGMKIKVLKYDTYQSLDSYGSTGTSTKKALRKHQESTPIHKNDKKVKKEKNIASQSDAGLIAELISSFEGVNPSFKRWYANTTQRGACDRLIVEHGLDKVQKVLTLLPKTNGMQFFPTITTPVQLEDKWAALSAAMLRKKGELETKQQIFI